MGISRALFFLSLSLSLLNVPKERRKMATQRRTVVTLRQQREPMQLPNVSISNLAAKKQEEKKEVKFGDVMKKASQKAFRGGVAGFAAGVIQVGSFMWMRTTMNYQYANGGTLGNALKTLYKEGGIPRFYRGLPIPDIFVTALRIGLIPVLSFVMSLDVSTRIFVLRLAVT